MNRTLPDVYDLACISNLLAIMDDAAIAGITGLTIGQVAALR
jgi:hypothetical protein